MSGAATLTVRFTGEVNDLEKKAQRAKRAIEGPMKDLEKPGFWSKVSGQAGKAGTDAGEKFSKNLGDKTKAGAGKLGGLMKLGLVGVAAKLGLDFGNEFMSALSGASNLEQSKGGLAAVFKKDTAELDKVAQGAAKNLGLSRNSYNELATVLGAGLKNKGLDDYADKTQKLIGLGSDLAAMYGGTTADSVGALASLMRGEADPAERYGIAISETAVNAELAAKGQDKLKGAALEQAKAQARLDILFRQTADAQGTFARESDTLAGKQQRAGAMWEDLKTKIGEKFLPAASGAMGWLMDKGIPGFERFASVAESSIGAVWDLFSKGDATNLLTMLGIDQDNKAVVWLGETRDMVVDAWGGIQGALEDAWTVVEPIATQIWDTLTTKWEEIAPSVEDTFGTVLRIIDEVMLAAELIIKGITDNISLVWDLWGDEILTAIETIFGGLATLFDGVATTIEGIWTTFTGILSGDWGKAADGIVLITEGLGTILGGLWDGIKTGALTAWSALVDGIGYAWDRIKGIVAKPINVVIGFINDGIIGSYNWVASKLGIGTIGRIPLMKTGASGRGSTGGRGTASAFAEGGYTGRGGKWEKAGDVHAGEYVLTQDEVDRAGGPAAIEARKRSLLLGYANGGLVRPVPQASSGWNGGRYRSGKWHGGLDFPAPVGQPIGAMWPGTVSRALSLTTSYGKHAIVDHGSGLQTLYAHMSRLAARVGQVVQAGGILGAVGSTGNSTGPHLHLEVRRNGKQLDPTGFLSGAAAGPSGGFLGAIAAGFNSVKDWFGSIMDRVGGAWSTLTGSAGGGLMGDLAKGIGDKLRDDLGAWVRGKLGYRSGGVAGSGLHWVGEGGPELLDLRGGERIRTLSQLRGSGQASHAAALDVEELVDRLIDAIRDMPQPELVMAEGDIRRVVQSEIRRGRA